MGALSGSPLASPGVAGVENRPARVGQISRQGGSGGCLPPSAPRRGPRGYFKKVRVEQVVREGRLGKEERIVQVTWGLTVRIGAILVAGAALFSVAGCKPDLSSISDEQLVQLLGSGGGGAVPMQIARRTVECAELLSGVSAEVHKDTPADFLGMMKTDCRQYLESRITDSARNTTELKRACCNRP